MTNILGQFKVHIRDIELGEMDEDNIEVVFSVSLPPVLDKNALMAELEREEGIEIERWE